MLLKKIIPAYKALLTLEEQMLPLKLSYNIFKLKKQLQPAWDFQRERENEILQQFPPQEFTNGNFKFKTVKQAKGFKAKMDELAEMDFELEVKPMKLQLTEMLEITPKDIEALDEFVIFEEFPEPEVIPNENHPE